VCEAVNTPTITYLCHVKVGGMCTDYIHSLNQEHISNNNNFPNHHLVSFEPILQLDVHSVDRTA